MDKRISRIKFIDPESKESLILKGNSYVSKNNKVAAQIRNEKIFFIGKEAFQNNEKDFIVRAKTFGKLVLGSYYPLIVLVFSPLMPRVNWAKRKLLLSDFIERYGRNKELVVNIGSGNNRYSDRDVNLDVFPFKEVDIVADAKSLPFSNNSVDLIINIQLLEHIESPDFVLSEAFRVLKKNGTIITTAPFIEQFHGSPDDYNRWSFKGMVSLHQKAGFKKVKVMPYAGPTGAMIPIVSEWLAIVLSFGFIPLYYVLFFTFGFLLLPLKVLDLIIINHKMSYKLSASNLYIGEK